MFTWDWMCKHTVFFTLRASQAAQGTGSTGRQAAQEDRQHREQAAQEDRQHRKTGSTGRQAAGSTRAYCTICSHGAQLHHQSILHNLFTVACSAQLHHQSILHNLFTVACSAQPQGVLSPVG